MESLYRTYRPLTFESVVGQQHIVSTLRHAVTEGRLSHAYLFCGPRGTGKTTMARILAKALLCEHAETARAEGASGCMPDGSCPECEAIAEGTHPDVYELDAASRTGVDNVREEIISSVSFAPVRGAYKVYIIDEVHMLTTAAFNALLKTLEEPPSHVVFVLCTTDPQKIPETILSRCQRFDFHRISNEDIVGRLRYICGQEGFEADDEALEIVARHARGGMRDALSTLEQLSVFGDGTVRVADARALLGEVSSTVLGEFARAIAARDVVALFGMVRRQVDEGNDLMEFTRDLVAHVRDVYTARVAGTQGELFDGTPDEVAALADEAAAFEGADRLARVLTVLDDAAIEMRTAADARLVLEIACTRLARPESDLTLEALAERLDRIEAQLAAGVPSAPLDAAGVAALTGAGHVAGRGAAPAAPSAGRAPAGAAAPVAGKTAPKASAGPAGAAPKASEPAEDLPWNAPAARTAPSASNAPAPAPTASGASEPTSSEGRAASSTPAPARPSPQGAAGEAVPMGGARSPLGARSVSAPASAAGTPEAAPAPASSGMRAPAPSVTGASAPDAAAPAAPAPGTAAGEGSPASPRSAGDPGELQRRWADVVKRVTAAQASRGALLQSSRARSDDGERLVIGFPKGSGFAIKMLGRPDSHELIAPIVEAVFGPRVVDYVMDGEGAQASAPSAPGSPSQGAAPVRAAGPSASRGGADAAAAGASPASSPVQGGPQGASSPVAASPEGAPAPDGPAPDGAPSAGSSSAQAAAGAPSVRAAGAPSGGSAEPAPGPVTPSAPGTPRPAGAPAAPRPTGAPAQAGPAESAPLPAAPGSAAAVDQTSGPTVVPERDIDADRRAWEDEQVPYDDAMIASYEDEEVPPFDIPGADAFAAPAPAQPAPGGAPASAAGAAPAAPVPSAGPAALAPASQTAPSRQAPSAGAPGAVPWAGAARASDAEETQVPQTEQEAKDLLNSVFGAGVVFRSE